MTKVFAPIEDHWFWYLCPDCRNVGRTCLPDPEVQKKDVYCVDCNHSTQERVLCRLIDDSVPEIQAVFILGGHDAVYDYLKAMG